VAALSGDDAIAIAVRVATVVLQLGLCALVLSIFVAGKPDLNLGPHQRGSAESMLDGTANRPYVLRALTPIVVRTALRVVPEETRDRLSDEAHARNPRVQKIVRYFETEPRFLPELGLLIAINFAALFGFMLCVRRLFETLFVAGRFAADAGSALSVLLLPPFFGAGGHFIYDLPSLFFFSAALLALARQRWVAFYLVAILGFVNKETLCLITIPFVIQLWNQLPRKQLATHVGIQLALFAGLRLALLALYGPDRPTGMGDDLIRDYLTPNLFKAWQSRFLYDWLSLAVIGGVLILTLRRIAERPRLLRASALVALPLAVGFLKGGMWGEIRVFYEVFPVFFLLGYVTALETLGLPVSVRPDQHGGPILANRRATELAWIAAGLAIGGLAIAVVYVGLSTRF